jgi:hypothetical protein
MRASPSGPSLADGELTRDGPTSLHARRSDISNRSIICPTASRLTCGASVLPEDLFQKTNDLLFSFPSFSIIRRTSPQIGMAGRGGSVQTPVCELGAITEVDI